MAEGEEEVDQLDDDEDADEPAVGAGGKRKKASAGAKDGAKKKAKTEKKKVSFRILVSDGRSGCGLPRVYGECLDFRR